MLGPKNCGCPLNLPRPHTGNWIGNRIVKIRTGTWLDAGITGLRVNVLCPCTSPCFAGVLNSILFSPCGCYGHRHCLPVLWFLQKHLQGARSKKEQLGLEPELIGNVSTQTTSLPATVPANMPFPTSFPCLIKTFVSQIHKWAGLRITKNELTFKMFSLICAVFLFLPFKL